MNTCCDLRESIVNVDCLYEPGSFTLTNLPGCLPSVYTVRFTAPADFVVNDNIVVDERNYAVMTSQMELADTGSFKAGAVMVCEIDRDRKYAFIRTGGASGSGEDVEFQMSDLVYYIDPLGDDSPNSTGAVDSPFKTLAGAGQAAWQNIVMNPLGKLVFSFNPGTYELTTAERVFITEAKHPLGMIFKGSEANSLPLIMADHFISPSGERLYDNLILHGENENTIRVLSAYQNAAVTVKNVEIVCSKPGSDLVYAYDGGAISIKESLKLNGNGNALRGALMAQGGNIWVVRDSVITIENIPSVTLGTVWSNGSHIHLSNANFIGTTTGKKYLAQRNGLIETLASFPGYIPGTISGTTETGGQYW